MYAKIEAKMNRQGCAFSVTSIGQKNAPNRLGISFDRRAAMQELFTMMHCCFGKSLDFLRHALRH